MHPKICFQQLMDNGFIIALNGLAQGKTTFEWVAGEKFFGVFGNTEITNASVKVTATVEKSGRYIGVDCILDGYVTSICDRCLEPLDLPVNETVRLSVKFGEEPSEMTDLQDGEREIVFLPDTDTELDLSQVVYDYICLAMPLQKVHPQGQCNPETVKYLGVNATGDDEEDIPSDSPFAALKTLLKD